MPKSNISFCFDNQPSLPYKNKSILKSIKKILNY